MLNFIKKMAMVSLLAVTLGNISQTYAAGEWDWLKCVKKDGSSRYAEWNYFSPYNSLELLNVNSKTAHKSVGGYTWLSGRYAPNILYLTDGSSPLILSTARAENACKELIKSCQLLDPDYVYVGAGEDLNVIGIKLDFNDSTVGAPAHLCPYYLKK